MRAVVVYESMFGNTQGVARAVAEGLQTWISVDLVEVGAAPTILGDDVALVVAGSPTHAFGMPRASTRRDAEERREGHPFVSTGRGLREWLDVIGRPPLSVAAAAFDTKANRPRLPGAASKGAIKRLRYLGFRVVHSPESFYVDGMTGPLVDGELDRARAWGEKVGASWAKSTASHEAG